MPNNISTFPIVDIVLAFAVLGIVIFSLFKIAQLITSRPDITAVLSITAIAAGLTTLFIGDPVTGLSVTITGFSALLLCALSHSRNSQPVRGK